MIKVALYQRFSTIHMGFLPCGVVTHFLVSITIAMTFLIGLIHHIQAPTVAELVEVLAVRVVRGTQEIDVGLFHEADVLLVGGVIHVTSRYRMVVVTIHATQLYILSVNLKHLTYALHALHTKVVVKMFDSKFFLVLQFYAERIKVRLFGRP